jgi:mannose-6-phosphate isomerase-like protein (cupin superfamily)
MLVKKLEDCRESVATDKTILREVLHRKNDGVDLRYSLAHARLGAGDVSLPHRLQTSEVYHFLKGQGIMHINQESQKVNEGYAVYLPPNAVQYVENPGGKELEFLCTVDPAWRQEDEEVITRSSFV